MRSGHDGPESAVTITGIRNLGIVVYRSHPSSERIISRILSTLKDESVRQAISRWIFPILPLRARYGGSTLLIPPRMKSEIADALNHRARVMIFDDAAISGRTIQDQLTAVKALGAENIQILTIANRLRLPSVTTQMRYFWQLDVPTMGRNGNCPLCQALETAKHFSGNMIRSSEAYRETLRWISAWSPASTLNQWDAGLDPLPLSERQQKHYCYQPSSKTYLANISIFRSTGLLIHAAELHAMTTSDNYTLRKIKVHDDPALKIGLAVSQLLLFGSELDQDLIRDIAIEGLLRPLKTLPNDSPYGSLAVLVIMRTLNLLSKAAQQEFVSAAKNDVGRYSNSRHGQILFAYMVSMHLIEWSDDSFYVGTRLLSARHCGVAEKLRALYRETISSAGTIHSEPIPRLKESLESPNSVPTENQIWSALASLSSLKDIVHELGNDMATASGGTPYSERRLALDFAITKAEKELEVLMQEKTQSSEKALNALRSVTSSLYTIADCFFERISPEEESRGRRYIERLESLWQNKDSIDWPAIRVKKKQPPSPDPTIRLSAASGLNPGFSNNGWVWVPWTRQIQSVIRDLLMNVIYRLGPIPDPWATGKRELAEMWINVEFGQQYVVISVANSSREDQQVVFDKVMKKSREKTMWDVLDGLGGSVSLGKQTKGDNRIIIFELQLPYALYLTDRKPK